MFIQAGNFYGYKEYINGETTSFYNSSEFQHRFTRDINMLYSLADKQLISLDAQIDSQAEKNIALATNEYLSFKAEIIRSELEYAVNNYDESYFNYEYTADLVPSPEHTTHIAAEPATEPDKPADDTLTNVPRNIETAKKALENSEGLEILDYEALVRDSAFETDFNCETYIEIFDTYDNCSTDYYTFYVHHLRYSEDQIKNEFAAQYNTFKKRLKSQYQSEFSDYEVELSARLNLKYYIVSQDDTVYTNTDENYAKANVTKKPIYITATNGSINTSGISDNDLKEQIENFGLTTNAKVMYVFLEDNLASLTYDTYSDMYEFHTLYNKLTFAYLTVICAVSLILSIVLFIMILCICGHKNGADGVVKAKIDRLPLDIHTILSVALTAVACYVFVELLSHYIWDYNRPHTFALLCYAGASACATGIMLTFTEWITSVLRIRKCGEKVADNLIIIKSVVSAVRKVKNFSRNIKINFTHKPHAVQRKTIACIIGYILINFGMVLLAVIGQFLFFGEIVAVLCTIGLIIFNIIVIIFALKYIRMFDCIVTNSKELTSVNFGNEKVPFELQILNENLANSNKQLNEAIAKAVRDEQLKTELITNVSHDLKTPLTSLISYSDLLSKCDIQDENAVKYTEVIHQQSIKLKRLIEDLIEASKVSSGNITLDKSVLNLSELAIQAIVEFSPETEKNGNEIKFEQPVTAPKVFADGAKTYRIIANLLNNAKKYSAPNTRIYVAVYTDGINGYFEIKNISSEPLNISPDELTERFVRGDKSRSREGNGLGLSIAKDLCSAQNGELKLIIDGDLFKAIVKLPCQEETEVKTE